jgi:hypothetical protein
MLEALLAGHPALAPEVRQMRAFSDEIQAR